MATVAEKIQLIIDMGSSGANVEEIKEKLKSLGQQAQVAGKSIDKSADESGKQLYNLSRGALQASQAFQDFAQGGIASTLNNVDGIVGSVTRSLGLSATAAAALSGGILTIGTALLVASPYIKKWYDDLTVTKNAIPEITDALTNYNDAIKENQKWLEKASDKGYLTDAELPEYNKRVSENTQLRKENAEAMKAQATAEKLAAVQTEEEADRSQRTAKILKERLAGDTEILTKVVSDEMQRQSQELKDGAKIYAKIAAQAAKDLRESTTVEGQNAILKKSEEQTADLEKKLKQVKQRINSEATNLVGDAVLSGSKESIDKISALLPKGQYFKDIFKNISGDVSKQIIDEITKDTKEIDDKLIKMDEDFNNRVESIAQSTLEKLSSLNEEFEKEIESTQAKEDMDWNEANPNHLARARNIIREVENSDFYETSVDKYGRETRTPGLRLSGRQVDEAAMFARSIQNNFGYDDQTAAQIAIQEQATKNQIMMADRQQQTFQRMNNVYQNLTQVQNIQEYGW